MVIHLLSAFILSDGAGNGKACKIEKERGGETTVTELSKKLIRLAADELRDEMKGALTIHGVIMALNEAARDLEHVSLRVHIDDINL